MTIMIEEDESTWHYTQILKALIHMLPNPPNDMLQMEWYIQGMRNNMAFKVKRSHLATLVVAILAVQNYKQVLSLVCKRRGKAKGHQCKKIKKEDKKKKD